MIGHQDESWRSHQPAPRGKVVSRTTGMWPRRTRQTSRAPSPSHWRAFLMPTRTPLADLIQARMEDLGLDREALGFRLGAYKNPLKAAGRVHALIDRHITTEKSRRALARLHEALEVDPEVVDRAVVATEELFAKRGRQAEEERR